MRSASAASSPRGAPRNPRRSAVPRTSSSMAATSRSVRGCSRNATSAISSTSVPPLPYAMRGPKVGSWLTPDHDLDAAGDHLLDDRPRHPFPQARRELTVCLGDLSRIRQVQLHASHVRAVHDRRTDRLHDDGIPEGLRGHDGSLFARRPSAPPRPGSRMREGASWIRARRASRCERRARSMTPRAAIEIDALQDGNASLRRAAPLPVRGGARESQRRGLRKRVRGNRREGRRGAPGRHESRDDRLGGFLPRSRALRSPALHPATIAEAISSAAWRSAE